MNVDTQNASFQNIPSGEKGKLSFVTDENAVDTRIKITGWEW